jgi:hypothetical protein
MTSWSSLRAYELICHRKTTSSGAYGAEPQWARGYLMAMLVTNHVLAGAVIGTVARGPAQAFALGVASHFALDAVPHWGDWRDRDHFMHVAVRDGLAGLAVMAAATAAAPAGRRLTTLAGMAGAAFPDIDKPTRVYLGFSPFPGPVNRFHSAIQRESLSRAPVEVVAGAAFVVVGLFARRKRSVATGRYRLPGRRRRRSWSSSASSSG